MAGGVTVPSSAVQMLKNSGPGGVSSPRFSPASSDDPGASWQTLVAHRLGSRAAATPASSVPWLGVPSSTTRRARRARAGSASSNRTTSPPAEKPTRSTRAAPVRSSAAPSARAEARRSPVPRSGRSTTTTQRPSERSRAARVPTDAGVPL